MKLINFIKNFHINDGKGMDGTPQHKQQQQAKA